MSQATGGAGSPISRLAVNARVIGALGRRSVVQTFRRPQLIAPILLFPTVLLAIQTAGAGRALDLPEFPEVNGFLDFMLAGAMIQAALLAGNSGGIALAVDLEMGFADRLFAAPISRYSIVLGRLAGAGALGTLTAIWFIAIGLIFGADIEQGIAGMLMMILVVSLAAVVFGGIGAAIALRTGTASVVQGLFPLVLVILFLSNAFFPANLLLEPARTVAEYNPLTFIVDGVREPVVGTLTIASFAEALGMIALVGGLSLTLSALALRRRLRTGG